jgi:putative transposase
MTRFARDPLSRRHRFPADAIAHAVWLYFRFPLSLRMVEDMLAARGVIVSHQTVRLWAEKFGRHFANNIRKRSAGRLGDKWHLDEVVITIAGKKHWLWRACDRTSFPSKPATYFYDGRVSAFVMQPSDFSRVHVSWP